MSVPGVHFQVRTLWLRRGAILAGCMLWVFVARLACYGISQPAAANTNASAAVEPGEDHLSLTNALVPGVANVLSNTLSDAELQRRLEAARQMRQAGQAQEAEPSLIELLAPNAPESFQQQALLELGQGARDQGELPRAQQIYAQFVNRWPDVPLLPEVLLRQGRLFREMGLNNLALAKFYSVMTSSLVLKKDSLDYYQRLVLLAQTEIAETHFQLGKFAEAADFLGRLLKQNNPALNRSATQFKLIRALSALERDEETMAQSWDFLSRFPAATERPEVRFHLALALKQLGRNSEALQQVLTLLQEQKSGTAGNPELWGYWQQRAGNEIGNQLYREGDYSKALEIYLLVARLDRRVEWQLPVTYQIGLVYERLAQPVKAIQSYQEILQREPELGTNSGPGLKAVVEMARWRASFVQWQSRAENSIRPQPAGATSGTATPETSSEP